MRIPWACNFRQGFLQSGDGFGMRMTDGDGPSVTPRIFFSQFELKQNGIASWGIVQKNLPICRGHAILPGHLIGDCLRGSAAVNEEQVAITQGRHQFTHQDGSEVAREPSWLLTPAAKGTVASIFSRVLLHVWRGHAGLQLHLLVADGVAVRLHGHMQQHLVAALISLFGNFP